MRDPFAPVIIIQAGNFDCDGIVNPWSFQCERFYTEKGDSATLLDGTSIHDVFPAKIRLSWTLTVLLLERYTAFCTALNSGATPDMVTAQVFDPTRNNTRQAAFHVTRPTIRTIRNFGQTFVIPQSALILEEVTPPTEGGNG